MSGRTREALLLLAATIPIAFVSVGILDLILSAQHRADFFKFIADNAIPLAAGVQAATAVVIVVLTKQLASASQAAVKVSQDQVATAQRASIDARRDVHVTSVPQVVIPGVPVPSVGIGPMQNRATLPVLRVENTSATQPALGIVLTFERCTQDGEAVAGQPPVVLTVGSLAPDTGTTVQVELGSFRPRVNPNLGKPDDRSFDTDNILVTLSYSGLLDQQVRSSYLWASNWARQLDAGVWQRLRWQVQAAIPDSEPVDVRFRRQPPEGLDGTFHGARGLVDP